MNLKNLLFLFIFCTSSLLKAAVVDTVKTFSASMNKQIKAVVIIPDTYSKEQEFPVVYLLHGFSDNYKTYITKMQGIENWADRYNIIIVCAEGRI